MLWYLKVIYYRWTCNLHVSWTPLCSKSQLFSCCLPVMWKAHNNCHPLIRSLTTLIMWTNWTKPVYNLWGLWVESDVSKTRSCDLSFTKRQITKTCGAFCNDLPELIINQFSIYKSTRIDDFKLSKPIKLLSTTQRL